MKTRRRSLYALLVATACSGAMLVFACVGDDPGAAGTSSGGNDSSTSTDTSTADTNTPPNDGGTGTDSAPAEDGSVNCLPGQPQLFASAVGRGPFCNGAGTQNHCDPGIHCCKDLTLGSQQCDAATCAPPKADFACFNSYECTDAGVSVGLVCCGDGKVRKDVCSYAVVEGMTKATCQASCSNEFQLCAGASDCTGGKTCTPARVLTPDGKSTSQVQVSACL
jgi:hypothetical protein